MRSEEKAGTLKAATKNGYGLVFRSGCRALRERRPLFGQLRSQQLAASPLPTFFIDAVPQP